MINDKEKKLVYSDHINSFPLKEDHLSMGLKVNHEIAHVVEKGTLTNKMTVSPVISKTYQNIYNHVLLLKLICSISHQFHQ